MATAPAPRIATVKDWVGVSAPFIIRDSASRDAGTHTTASRDPASRENAPHRNAAPQDAAATRPRRWPATRIAAVEALWGAGFNGPGGAAEILRLAGPLALGRNDTLLLVGGGMGGPACTVAESSGAWVYSYEAEAELAALARQRITTHPGGARVLVEHWSPHAPDFGIRASDHALALEALRGADPTRALHSMATSLRPGSRIVMTEMVAGAQVPGDDREFAAWCRLENRLPTLPEGEAITTALTRLRYDVREVEDVSQAHVSAALSGWRQAVQTMGQGPVPAAASASVVVTEAELWLLRIRVMRRFGLRLLRWHAVGHG